MAAVVVRRRRLRNHFRRNRIFRDRTHPLDIYDDIELYAKYRFRRGDILIIVNELRQDLEYPEPRQGCLPATSQVLVALRMYATGSFQSMVADTMGIDQSTVSRTISRVTNALVLRMHEWVHLPTQQQADQQKVKFLRLAGFPNVWGCIDGTHVRIQAPSVNEHEYVNRKNFHSINVQIVCDADMNIVNCIARWPGAVHDARILRESPLFEAFELQQKPLTGVLLGDSGYMLRDWLMTPILNARDNQEQAYTDAHCITRCTVERCIGVLKRRWHCLHGEIRFAPVKACKVICACVMLHNRATQLGLPPPAGNDADHQPDNNPPPLCRGNIPAVAERVRTAAGKATRDAVVRNYF